MRTHMTFTLGCPQACQGYGRCLAAITRPTRNASPSTTTTFATGQSGWICIFSPERSGLFCMPTALTDDLPNLPHQNELGRGNISFSGPNCPFWGRRITCARTGDCPRISKCSKFGDGDVIFIPEEPKRKPKVV